jgi:hexosaminidase
MTGDTLKVELSTEIPGLNIHYTFDNSFPDEYYPKYTGPLTVPKDAITLRAISYRENKPIGRNDNSSDFRVKGATEKKVDTTRIEAMIYNTSA